MSTTPSTPAMPVYNERSWAGELESQINQIADRSDLKIKRASIEPGVHMPGKTTKFSDILLFGDSGLNIVLQNWEIKLPDTKITDSAFIKDVQDKANDYGLNSCLIWNFTAVVLYMKNDNGTFYIVKQWNDTSFITSREDVKKYELEWKKLLEEVIFEINGYFMNGTFKPGGIGKVISTYAMSGIISRHKSIVSDELNNRASKDSRIGNYITSWWRDISAEYEKDEKDPYVAYAKTILLNWTTRIVFAHLIKGRQNGAMLIDKIDSTVSPTEANDKFEQISKRCDFYNIFSGVEYCDLIPQDTWEEITELSSFMRDNHVDSLKQEDLQAILEQTVDNAKKSISGQYATPEELAKILVRLTVINWREPFMDCCCGTGTIPKVVISYKKKYMPPKDAVESVWASDKNEYPLQVANISLADADSINIANRLFRHNALDLKCGDKIDIVDPETGKTMNLQLPEFGAIASNLPFVEYSKIPPEDKKLIEDIPGFSGLHKKTDLYAYVALKISDILKDHGRLGIITSNSWLGTKVGRSFFRELKARYKIEQVHISGCNRWFKNPDVVATILILEKLAQNENVNADETKTGFYLWQKSLDELADNIDVENKLIESASLEKKAFSYPDVVKVSQYSMRQIDAIAGENLSYNVFFHNVAWFNDVLSKNVLVKIDEVYKVFRGSRRGCDVMFFPSAGNHGIEPQFIKKVLKNAKGIDSYTAVANDQAFCCSLSMSDLHAGSYDGAIKWIEKFEGAVNGTGQPLVDVLKRSGMQWYEMQTSEMAEVVTMMNPDKRFFFSKFDEPAFINQRLIGLTGKPEYSDAELNFALLNSIITIFSIEGAGFGRGLGVLDINKENIAGSYMINPRCISESSRKNIIEKFNVLKARKIKPYDEELNSGDRISFEMEVLEAVGLETYFDDIKDSLLSMQKARFSARL